MVKKLFTLPRAQMHSFAVAGNPLEIMCAVDVDHVDDQYYRYEV